MAAPPPGLDTPIQVLRRADDGLLIGVVVGDELSKTELLIVKGKVSRVTSFRDGREVAIIYLDDESRRPAEIESKSGGEFSGGVTLRALADRDLDGLFEALVEIVPGQDSEDILEVKYRLRACGNVRCYEPMGESSGRLSVDQTCR